MVKPQQHQRKLTKQEIFKMKKICIVASKYYEDIIDMLIDGTNDAIRNQ